MSKLKHANRRKIGLISHLRQEIPGLAMRLEPIYQTACERISFTLVLNGFDSELSWPKGFIPIAPYPPLIRD